MKEPTHFFNLESRAKSNNRHLIFFNFNYGFSEFDLKTKRNKYLGVRISSKWSIEKNYWNKSTYRANKTYARMKGRTINNNLDEIEEVAYNQLSLFRNTYKENPHPKVLKNLILEELGRKEKKKTDILIVEFIESEIKRRTMLPKGTNEYWSKNGAGKEHQNFLNQLKSYESFTKKTLTFQTLNEDIYWDFFRVINDIRKNNNGIGYSQNSIAKASKNFLTNLKSASEKYEINFKFSNKKYKIPKWISEKIGIYLNEIELKTVIDSDVSHSRELTHAKNYIIISSFTGLRIGNMRELNLIKPAIKKIKENEFYYFAINIVKAGDNNTIIPMLKPVKKLLKNYDNTFPNFPSDKNIRKDIKRLLKYLDIDRSIIDRKKYYLVDNVIEKEIKLYEIFKPHDCRSTFITNLSSLGINTKYFEIITHPKKNKSVIASYNKANQFDKINRFINDLKLTDSDLYTN